MYIHMYKECQTETGALVSRIFFFRDTGTEKVKILGVENIYLVRVVRYNVHAYVQQYSYHSVHRTCTSIDYTCVS